jgi:hypothetical protein
VNDRKIELIYNLSNLDQNPDLTKVHGYTLLGGLIYKSRASKFVK